MAKPKRNNNDNNNKKKNPTTETETTKKKKTTPEEEIVVLKEKAPSILNAVDNATFFTTERRYDFPTFDATEIQSGSLLGTGGFSAVTEITQFTLLPQKDSTTTKDDAKINNGDNDDDNKEGAGNDEIVLDDDDGTDIHDHHVQQDDIHYDVTAARQVMNERCLRYGSSRYAIKQLKSDLSELDRVRGMIDLAIEIRFFRALFHPNIVKMRGHSSTPELSVDTFIIMDRLYGTLDDKIDQWAVKKKEYKGFLGFGTNKSALSDMMKDQLLVAYDLSAAFTYMHKHKLVYRDIKPDNIGFDIRGSVKVFDFGLMKPLDPNLKAKGVHGYNLTKTTGSIPYMAPEVMLGQPYDTKADVFSFSILLWEILSLKWAFQGTTMKDYYVRVCKQNERLPIKRGIGWSVVIRTILAEGWHKEPNKRPTMQRYSSLIRGDLKNMTADAAVLNRTQHMLNISDRSFRMNASSNGR